MSGLPAAAGLEPLGKRHLPGSYEVPHPLDGQTVNIHGERVKLAGLPRPRSALVKALAILGPGLISASAGNDAGGIATYSSAGAKFGYSFIWVMLVVTVCLGLVQEMCARLGAATGRGLLDLIRERYGLAWSVFAITLVTVANIGLVVSEFAGIGAASELFGISRYVSVPLAALGLWALILFGSFDWAEKLFLGMTVVFFAYPVAAIMGHPSWGQVAQGAFVPQVRMDHDYLFLMVALLGTTITPFMQVFHQSFTVEKGASRTAYGLERWDAYVGAVFSNLMSIAMIIATAATVYALKGPTELATAADAALALEPVMGAWARTVFAVGLLGACLLAAAVVPLATSYAVAETFGFPKGVGLDYRRAPLFFGLFTLLLVVGGAVALIPGLPLMPLLVGTQVFNGVLLPVLLVFILLLCNDGSLMGDLKNGRFQNLLGWGTCALITVAVVAMFVSQVMG